MKRFMVCAAALLGLVVFCQGTAQAAVRYELAEVGISIELPEDYITITRDTPEYSPIYDMFEVDKETLDSVLEERHCYLDAVNMSGDKEISVSMLPMPMLRDFADMEEYELKVYKNSFQQGAETQGMICFQSETYEHPQVKFIEFYSKEGEDADDWYSLTYHTVYNKMAISIAIGSSQEITQEERTLARTVVDSTQFAEKPAEPWEYVDSEAGISFFLPADWREEPLSKSRQFIDAKFANAKEPGLSMIYGSNDIWGMLTEDEKRGLTREDLDIGQLSEEELSGFAADIAGAGVSLTRATYAGRTYCIVKKTVETQLFDSSVAIPVMIAFGIEDGYLFSLQFTGDENSACFSDFEAALNSLEIHALEAIPTPTPTPAPSVAPSAPPAYTDTRNTRQSGADSEEQFVWAVIAFAVIGVAALLLWDWHRRRAARKAAEPSPTYSFVPAQDLSAQASSAAQDAPAESPDAPAPAPSAQTPEKPREGGCCPTCGAPVPPGVRFCHRCGSRLQSEERKGENEG